MIRTYHSLIGLRYLRAKRRSQYVSFISLISMLGMVLGVAALITVLSVMNGFEKELQGRLLKAIPHAQVIATEGQLQDWRSTADDLTAQPGIDGAAPYIQSTVMLISGGSVRGANLVGIDPQQEKSVSEIHRTMVAGGFDDLEAGRYGLVLGNILAQQLGVTIGDKLNLVLPEIRITALGAFPRMKRMTVLGVFQAGAQVDASEAFVHLGDAQKLLRYGDSNVEGIRVKVADMYAVDSSLQGPMAQRDDLRAVSWIESNQTLFSAIAMEKTMMTLLLLIVVAVAVFNVISVMTMLVNDKRSDIAVLRTLGASPMGITRVFLITGCSLGMVGTIIGTLLGVALALNIGDIVATVEKLIGMRLFNPDVYYISFLPSQLQWPDVSMVVVVTLVLSLLATVYPAWRASKIQPAEALSYE